MVIAAVCLEGMVSSPWRPVDDACMEGSSAKLMIIVGSERTSRGPSSAATSEEGKPL